MFTHVCVFFYNLNVSQAWTPMIVAALLIPSFWWSHQLFSLWLCHPKDNMNPIMSPNLHHMEFFFFVLSACACFPFIISNLMTPSTTASTKLTNLSLSFGIQWNYWDETDGSLNPCRCTVMVLSLQHMMIIYNVWKCNQLKYTFIWVIMVNSGSLNPHCYASESYYFI